MPDEKTFKERKPHLTVGTIGHFDHGKTTLTYAITTVLAKQGKAKIANYDEIDEAPEEKTRGMPIQTLHAEYETEKRHYTHIDSTGLADYVKSMMTSATEMDAAILVVSATDGSEIQTYEHILLSRQVGLEHIVVYLNKCDQLDLDDEYIFELVEDEIRGLLTQYGFNGENTVIIRGSALMALIGEDNDKGYGVSSIERLMDALDSGIPEFIRNLDSPFLMPVGDVFSITGMKTCAVGKIESGIIKIGDEVELVGLRDEVLKTTIDGIETFRKQCERGVAGDKVALLLRGINKNEVERGMVLAKPRSIKTHTKFKAAIYVLKPEEGGKKTPFHSGYKPQFYFRTTEVTGEMVELLDGEDKEVVEMVIPGENINATVHLSTGVVMSVGLRFAIRESGRTIGVGTILEILE